MSFIRRLVWPLPAALAGVVVFGVFTAVCAAAYTVGAWYFVPLSRLSGVSRETILYAGPYLSVLGCVLAGSLFSRSSPASSPLNLRSSGSAVLRVLIVLYALALAGWAVAQALLFAVFEPRAVHGSIHWLETVMTPGQLLPFVALGVLFGLLSDRWWSPAVVVIVSVAWIGLLPVIAGPHLPRHTYSVGHEFLFPATPSYRHEPFIALRLIGYLVFWLLVLLLLTSIVLWITRVKSGFSARPSLLMGVGFGGVALLAYLLITNDEPLYGPLVSDIKVCREVGSWTYCVSEEEAVLMDDLITQTRDVIDRAGPLGEDRWLLESVTLWMWDGMPKLADNRLITPVTESGVVSADWDVAGALAGLENCGSSGESAQYAYELAAWLGDKPERSDIPSSFARALENLSPSARNDWFSRHRDEIRSCKISEVVFP
ncbi:hypothetical protein [Bowdeniella nasicola]|uniref:hypothetical protein n=1 Tax=Bowdeniella nasicola TaxID=208480 RepID=UPI0011610EED|nr:hypothetical protein [Bowdeniella nasicola]